MLCLVQELGANVNRNSEGSTPLHAACFNGCLASVRCLIKELGANINALNNEGSTPLHIAGQYGYLAIVRWLVKEGANTQISSRFGTPAALFTRQGASTLQTASYLGAKTHCASPSCSGTGIMKCTGWGAGTVLWGAVPAGPLESAQG
jgi:ankyrin repeat protein